LPNDAKSYPKDKRYTWDAFQIYDLKSHTVTKSNISPPQKYAGGVLDIPYIYTSQALNRYFVISYSLDKSIAILDLSNNEVSHKKINYLHDQLEPISTYELKKDEAKDAMQKS
jgi:hypothetical protein